MIEMKNAYCGLALALAAAPAIAADMSEPRPVAVDSGWTYQVTLDGWLAGLNGDIGVRGHLTPTL